MFSVDTLCQFSSKAFARRWRIRADGLQKPPPHYAYISGRANNGINGKRRQSFQNMLSTNSPTNKIILRSNCFMSYIWTKEEKNLYTFVLVAPYADIPRMNGESTSMGPTHDVSNVGCAGKRFPKYKILFRRLYLLIAFSAGRCCAFYYASTQRPYPNQDARCSVLPHIHVTYPCTSAWAEVYISQKHINLLSSGSLDRVVW
jgi:hypothetical protein